MNDGFRLILAHYRNQGDLAALAAFADWLEENPECGARADDATTIREYVLQIRDKKRSLRVRGRDGRYYSAGTVIDADPKFLLVMYRLRELLRPAIPE